MCDLTNDYVKKKYDKMTHYEFNRWFNKRALYEDYVQIHKSLEYHLKGLEFTDCLEVGCGPGTWTRFLMLSQPTAIFTLVDISKEMLNQASILDNYRVVSILSSFKDFKPSKDYDFFFSSRAIEYMTDKELVIKKIINCLRMNSYGFIITKNPNSFGRRLHRFLGLKTKLLHTHQICNKELIKLLKKNGSIETWSYPCAVSIVPFFKLHKLNFWLWKKIHNKQLNWFLELFTECYIVKFSK